MVNLEIGQKIISRSNNYKEPAQVGTFVGWTEITKSNVRVPLIEIDGKTYLGMGIIFPYHDGLFQLFNSITPKEAYELARDISITIQVTHFQKEDK